MHEDHDDSAFSQLMAQVYEEGYSLNIYNAHKINYDKSLTIYVIERDRNCNFVSLIQFFIFKLKNKIC